MKFYRKIAAAVLCAVISLPSVAVRQVGAESSTKETKVTYRDIAVVLDGKIVELTDTQGNVQEPVIVYDTVYVPASALARAFGGKSSWDGKANTLTIKVPTAPAANAPEPTPTPPPVFMNFQTDAGAAFVQTTSGSRNAKITYRDITVIINDETVVLTDTKGNVQEPFILFDTVYAPLSAFARELGKTSKFDGTANTVTITSPATPTPAPTPTPTPAPTPTPTPTPAPATPPPTQDWPSAATPTPHPTYEMYNSNSKIVNFGALNKVAVEYTNEEPPDKDGNSIVYLVYKAGPNIDKQISNWVEALQNVGWRRIAYDDGFYIYYHEDATKQNITDNYLEYGKVDGYLFIGFYRQRNR